MPVADTTALRATRKRSVSASGPAPEAAAPGAGPCACAVDRSIAPCRVVALEGLDPALSGAHAHDRVDRGDPDLAVTDASGLAGLDDHLDDVIHVGVIQENLEPNLGDQVDGVLRASVDLGVALLPAVAAGLADGHAMDPEGLQSRPHVVQLERLDNCGDELHAFTFP